MRSSSAQLVAAAGAVGAALIAGLQIGNVGKLAEEPVLLGAALLAFVTAMAVVGTTVRRASRVLVVSRTTISDLLREELKRRARDRSIALTAESDLADPDMPWVLDQIAGNREWLLPDHASAGDLYTAYEEARKAAELAVGPVTAGAAEDLAELSRRVNTVCAFARSELSRRAYKRLSETVTGWPGRVFTAAVISFAVAVSWPVPQPPAVTAAYRLDVLLTGQPAALRKAGLPAECLSGTRLTGVALDGTLTAPVVVTEATTATVGKVESKCSAARFTVTEEVGIPMPYIAPK